MAIYGFKTRAALRALSEDSRISITNLAKTLKCSRMTASKILGHVTDTYQIKFGMELDEDKLGMSQRHLLIIKLEKKPKMEELRELFKDDPYVMHAFLCKGDFDLMIQVVSGNSLDYIVWESLLPGKLIDYGVELFPSQLMLTNFGYLPMDTSAILKMAQNVSDKDRKLLALLNDNSRLNISEMSSLLNMGRSTINYRIHSLLKSGIIKRFTISVNKAPAEYILTYAANYHFNKTSSFRSVKMMEYYKQYDTEMPLLNTFQLLAPMSGSFRFLGIALFNDEATARRDVIKVHKDIFKEEDVRIKSAQVIGLVKGSFPFRNMNMEANYRRFKWRSN